MKASIRRLKNLMRKWEEKFTKPDFNPTPILNKICEILECYPKKDLGTFKTILHKHENFMIKLFMDYLNDNWSENVNENNAINIAACRLIINIKENFTTHVKNKPIYVQILKRLFNYAQSHFEPLHTCTTSLLAIILEDHNIASLFREDIIKLLPVVLNRLKESYNLLSREKRNRLRAESLSHPNNFQTNDNTSVKLRHTSISNTVTAADSNQNTENLKNPSNESEDNGMDIDHDLSSLAYESVDKNVVHIDSLALTKKIIYHLKFMLSCGKIKVLGQVFDEKNLYVVMEIIELSGIQNRYLSSLAFMYLDVLLRYNSYAIEFMNSQGLQKLISLPKSSISEEYVTLCLHNLSHSEEVMERVRRLPKEVLVDLTKYVLSMLELSNSMSNAMGFFANSFSIRVILEIFDNHGGLRKLINAIASQKLLSIRFFHDLKYSEKKILYNFCWSLKEYFEAHLHIKVQQIQRAEIKMCTKTSPTIVNEEIELLSNILSKIENWTPVDQLIQFGGLNLILIIINGVQEWTIRYSYDIVCMALKVLNVCAALPYFRLTLCEPRRKYQCDIYNNGLFIDGSQLECAGLNIVIKAAEKNNSHVCVRKEALVLLITCACAPIYMGGGIVANKKEHLTNDDAMVEKIWNCIRNYNGIMFLLASMNNKTHGEDAIRGLASCALAGCARSESVRQILSKLPLFKKDHLQDLMEHSEPGLFKKNVSKLMDLIHGKTKTNNPKIEASLNLSVRRVNNNCTNFAMRFSNNIHSRRLDQKLVHSRFYSSDMFLAEDSVHCKFINPNRIAVGTKSGYIKVFNLFNRFIEELSILAHTSSILNIECSNDERLLVSSCNSISSLWSKSGESISLKYSLSQKHCTFSNHFPNKLLGTNGEIATIYDVETHKYLMTLIPKHSNQFHKNKATFNPSDKLVLSDGILWDAISGKEIHKFDKLHTNVSGIFHPNRFEIISNTEVWDVRTFKLLSTVPHLDEYNLIFSNSGEGMYTFIDYDKPFQTSFKTLDPWDYSLIATIDVKMPLLHMAINKNDTQIAVIGATETIDSNIIELYDVGRPDTEIFED